MPSEKVSPKQIYRPLWRKEDYEVDTNEKNCNTDDSPYDNDGFVKLGQRTRV